MLYRLLNFFGALESLLVFFWLLNELYCHLQGWKECASVLMNEDIHLHIIILSF